MFVLETFYKRVGKDNWENGADPDTSQLILANVPDTYHQNIEDLIGSVMPDTELEEWCAFENGRITFNRLEDDNGFPVGEDDPLFKRFKAGKVDLWIAGYDIWLFTFKENGDGQVAEHTPTVAELVQLGFQEY